MTLFGIALRRPSFHEFTAASVLAIGLWLFGVGVLHAAGHPLQRTEAGAALLVAWWACVAARVGIEVGRGGRHLAANMAGAALLLGVYQAAWALAG